VNHLPSQHTGSASLVATGELTPAVQAIRDINLSNRPIDAIRATLTALRVLCGVHSASLELTTANGKEPVLIATDRDDTHDTGLLDLYRVAYPLDVRFPAWRSSSIIIEETSAQAGENVQQVASLLRILGTQLDRQHDNVGHNTPNAASTVREMEEILGSVASIHDAREALAEWYRSRFDSSFAIVRTSGQADSPESRSVDGMSFRRNGKVSTPSLNAAALLGMPARAASLLVADRMITGGTSLQIIVGHESDSAWSDGDHLLFQAATTVAEQHLARMIDSQHNDLNTRFLGDMQELALAASSAADLDELCKVVNDSILRFVPADRTRVKLDLYDQGMETVCELGRQVAQSYPESASSDEHARKGESSIVAPLLADGAAFGFIEVENDEIDAFTCDQTGILEAIAQSAAGAYERHLLLNRIARQTRHETGLRLIAERVNATLDVSELVRIASSVIFDTVPSQLVVVSVIDRATRTVGHRSYQCADLEFSPPAIGFQLRENSITFDAIRTMQQRVVTDRGMATYSTFSTPPWVDFGSVVATPIAINDDLAGVIVVAWQETGGCTESALSVQRQIASMLGTSLQNAFAYADQLRHTRDLSELQYLTSRIASQLDLRESLDEIARSAAKLVDADGCAVAMIEDATLQVASAIGVAAENLLDRMPLNLNAVARIIEDAGYVAINDLAESGDGPRLEAMDLGCARSLLAVRLTDPEGRPAGVIGVLSIKPREWSEREIALLTTLSSASGVAIQNARHFEKTRDLLRASVESLATAVDAKDPGAQNHARQVAGFARMIADELDLGPERVSEIELAALLHDVGKIGIPDSVLEKPGQLDSAEWAAVQMHPEIGEQILSGNPALESLLPMVRHHHERWDGNGYPDRLSGARIPEGAAIIAVAEALDAMTAHRPYQPAKSWSQAIGEILAGSGSQFAPFAVNALTRLQQRGVFLRDQERLAQHAPEVPEWHRTRSPSLDVRALRIMEAVAVEIRAGAGLEQFLGNVVKMLRVTLDVPYLAIFSRSPETGSLRIVASDPVAPLEDGIEDLINKGEGLVSWVARHGVAQNIGDAAGDERCIQGIKGISIQSELCVPLLADGQIIGVINFESHLPDAFTEADERLLMSTADHIANAIHVVQLHERLKVLSSTDALTGLANHRAFFEQLVEEASRAQTHKSEMSVVILDVNNLKDINDSYGHLVGDAALRAVADVLSEHRRDGDVICRYGGDEFAMILPGTSKAEAWRLVENLALDLLDGEFEAEAVTMPLPTSSFGIATAPEDGHRPIELLAAADERMYVQKAGEYS
jgi:diguanylate cyclase (GGDEF)-like protein